MNNSEYQIELNRIYGQIDCEHLKYWRIDYTDSSETIGIYSISLDSSLSIEEYNNLEEHDSIKKYINTVPIRNNIIYIGETSDSIKKRLYQDELGGCYLNGKQKKSHHATFYRKLGSVLGFKSINPTDKILKESQRRNFVFNLADNEKIRNWIQRHLRIKYFKIKGTFISDIQNALILNFHPTFNGTHNPKKCETISLLIKRNRERDR